MNDKLEDNMGEEMLIEPVSEKFLLWRCLYSGPLSAQTIDKWPSGSQMDWERFRNRNPPLLAKLTRTYGACAILARADDKIVGQIRHHIHFAWASKIGLFVKMNHFSYFTIKFHRSKYLRSS